MVDMNDPEVIESLRYLLISKEERIKNTAMPFDSKKNCFIPDQKDGFVVAEIENRNEEKGEVTVKLVSGETKTVKKDDVLQMNPPKYEKCDDMADLTYLNDATILHNLRQRYMSWYIYTYSGLFCVAINPYKRLPVYTMKMVHYYRGKKKNEVPPHLYLVADNAYSCMMKDRENQSMLITGESGAGKTENTKKVIQYFAFVAAANAPKHQKVEISNKPSLEEQIVSTNPVLEAYGNAKTTRNNNSSRFGKFIRIHFSNNFAIAGADIESYLLEKSRVTYQLPIERNYHIFYQLTSSAFPDLVKELLLEQDPSKYYFISQGVLAIDGVDDTQEMRDTKKAFETLMFTENEQLELFKCTAAVAIWGNSKWKQKPREEQAEADSTEENEKVSTLLGLNINELLQGLLKPKIKVGNEFVNKGQNKDQVVNSVGALSKAIYNRCFVWLVDKCNETLDVKEIKRQYYIGVLDIAGFEAFDFNGLEQLCINYTNERLQQFFNNFMFVLEQEEYKKEGIVWEMMSFGADLQATIDLIEKPMGVLSILEEECIVPKASDKTFQEKLYAQHLGKHSSFGKPKPQKGKPETHFDLHHYAGTVSYTVTGWLEKNKDPINTTVAALFKASKGNSLLSLIFQDIGVEEEKGAGGKKSGKSGSQQTISSGHREQLSKLMKTLGSTHPHFVRCIIPNEVKTGGILDAHLVMHQLRCNGVLEGIRICRKGFPSRLIYSEFVQRYSILSPNAVKENINNPNKATTEILQEVALDPESYRLGLTKVLFKAGVLGTLEEHRDTAVSNIISMLQSQIRCFLVKKNSKQMVNQKLSVSVLQKNLKAYQALNNWPWWNLMINVKPLLQGAKKEEERRAREAEEARLAAEKAAQEAAEALKRQEEARLKEEEKKRAAEQAMQNLKNAVQNAEQESAKLHAIKANLEHQVRDLEDKMNQSESYAVELNSKKKKLENEINELVQNIQDTTNKLHKSEAENKSKESHIRKMQDDIASQDETNTKLLKEKKRLEEFNARTLEQLQEEEDKVNHLNKLKTKLEISLDEYEENLEREKKGRADLDKVKRRLESELKFSQSQIDEMEKSKKDIEDLLKRKETELNNTLAKVEDEHAQVTLAHKRVKELQQHLIEAEEAIEVERQAKVKAEKQRTDLSRELDELNDKLEEAGGATTVQVELNKKREIELAKLRRDLDEANAQHESTAASLRKKHQDAVVEMSQQIDQLQKAKIRLEKEKQLIKTEADEAKSQIDLFSKGKSNSDKLAKQLEQQLQELNGRLEESVRQNNEIIAQKSRLQSENSNLLSQLEETENRVSSFSKIKQQLQLQIEEAKRAVEEETRNKNTLVQQIRNLNQDLELSKTQTEDEHNSRVELQKQLTKTSVELQQYKSKYESVGLARADELEEAKKKLAAKLLEAEDQVEQALAKCSSLEKAKLRLQSEMEDLMVDVEKANSNALNLEKKQKQFDKLIGDWKQKCENITLELEASQKEARQYSSEMFKLRAQYQESQETIETIRTENKNLALEIKDLMDQLGNGGKNVHEMHKAIRKIETEKEEIHKALEEAESLLEQRDSKVLKAELEISMIRVEIERRMHEKEEEYENIKRNHQRAIESMQASLETEAKAKMEAIKQKKKLELSTNELEISLDNANRLNAESQKTNKKLQLSIIELQAQLEDEQKQKYDIKEQLGTAERQCSSLFIELEELRVSLESNEKARKATEIELKTSADRISELSITNANLLAQKRKLENDFSVLKNDLDDALNELKNSEERFKKANIDAIRLTDEIRKEKEHIADSDKLRKMLEQQVRDFQNKLSEAEAAVLKSGKTAIMQLEKRIYDLQNELESEQKYHQETLKEVKRNEKRIKELILQGEDDRKNQIHLNDLVEKLQCKLKAYRKQVEEAEEIASLNLSKYRKAQNDLAEASERADQAENQVAKVRAKNRNTLSIGRGSSPQKELNQHRASSHIS